MKLKKAEESNRFIYKVIRFKEIRKDQSSKLPYCTSHIFNFNKIIVNAQKMKNYY